MPVVAGRLVIISFKCFQIVQKKQNGTKFKKKPVQCRKEAAEVHEGQKTTSNRKPLLIFSEFLAQKCGKILQKNIFQ